MRSRRLLWPARWGRGLRWGGSSAFWRASAATVFRRRCLARIRGWAARYGQVSLRQAVILETRSAQVMAQLRRHERIRGYLRRALSPTHGVGAGERLAAFDRGALSGRLSAGNHTVLGVEDMVKEDQ